MKTPPFPGPPDETSAAELFVEAVLNEHARLGSGEDEDLVRRILVATVDRSACTPPRRPAPDWRLRATAAAAAAALVALLFVALSTLPFSSRETDQFHFVVSFVEAPPAEERGASGEGAAPSAAPSPARPAPAPGEGIRFSDPLPLGGAPDFALEDEWLPHPGIDSSAGLLARGGGVRRDSLRITADRSETLDDRLVYSGNVVVEHAEFVIEAEEVTLPSAAAANPGETQAPSSALSASEATVRRKDGPGLARAGVVRFDPASGLIELAGLQLFEPASGAGPGAEAAPGGSFLLAPGRFEIEPLGELRIHASPRPTRP